MESPFPAPAKVSAAHPGLEIRETGYAGKGLFATKSFKAGELLFLEPPLCFSRLTDLRTFSDESLDSYFRASLMAIICRFAVLSEADQRRVWDLETSRKVEKRNMRYLANVFGDDSLCPRIFHPIIAAIGARFFVNGVLDPEEGTERHTFSVHETLAQVNHACKPNAARVDAPHANNFALVCAIHQIEAGDEINRSYDTKMFTKHKANRQQYFDRTALSSFTCACHKCTNEDASHERACAKMREKQVSLCFVGKAALEIPNDAPTLRDYLVSAMILLEDLEIQERKTWGYLRSSSVW